MLDARDDEADVGRERSLPEISAGKFICDPNEIIWLGGPIAVATIASGFSAYAFARYASNFLQDFGGGFSSYVIGFACAVPIALLSGVSGGRCGSAMLTDPVTTMTEFGKKLISFGIWQRSDLWDREVRYSGGWFVLQVVNGITGAVKYIVIPLSVFASDAQNLKRSETWLSAGPNSGTSFLMNAYYLGKVTDMTLDMLAAWLLDGDRSRRQTILRMLSGIKREMPAYAKAHPEAFLQWLTRYKDCQNQRQRLIQMARLQLLFPERDPKNYHNPFSWLGLLMLIPAFGFTLPLVRAGQIASTVFGSNAFTRPFFAVVPWIAISISSFVCNFAINGENSYHAGHDMPKYIATATPCCRSNSSVPAAQRHGKENIVTVILYFSLFVSVCAAFAQATTAYVNPLFPAVLWYELILVAIGALAIYFRASFNNMSQAANFYHRWGYRDSRDFLDTYQSITSEGEKIFYLELLCQRTVDEIHGLERDVLHTGYYAREGEENFNIVSLTSDETMSRALATVPAIPISRSRDWCRWFRSAPSEEIVEASTRPAVSERTPLLVRQSGS